MTDRYVIFGNPVAHSKSPDIHAAFARETKATIIYERVLVPLDGFVRAANEARESGCQGANVTLPFKVEAFHYATTLTSRAKRAGAVNTLKFDGAMILGDNTDGVGLCADVQKNLAFNIAGARVLVMGAGGAARGVIGDLLDASPLLLAMTNRSIEKAEAIAAEYNRTAENEPALSVLSALSVVSAQQLPDQQFDLIINATSASLTAELPAIPPSSFAPNALAYDMMYGKGQTPFLALAASVGARTSDGLGMLVEQAAESFTIWRGVRPSTAPVLAMLRKQLGQAN